MPPEKILPTFLLLFSLYGCGLFTDDDPPKEDIFPEVEAIFDDEGFDTEKFYRFFEEPITREIDYIENRFRDYARYVKRNDTNTITKKDVKFFVSQFLKNQEEDLHRGIDTIFAVNSLFLGTGQETISLGNIEKLFNILRRGNLHFAAITKAARDYEAGNVSLDYYRESFNNNLTALSKAITENLSPDTDAASALIAPLMDNFTPWMAKNGIPENTLRDSLPDTQLLKMLLVGGEKETISLGEVRLLMQRITALSGPFFDFYYIGELNIGETIEYVRFVGDRMRTIFDVLGSNPRSLSRPDLEKSLKTIFDNLPGTFTSAITLFVEGSFLFSGNSSEMLTLTDLKKTFTILYEAALAYGEVWERSQEERRNDGELQDFRQWFITKATDVSRIVSTNISSNNTSLSLDTSLINHITTLFRDSPLDEGLLETVLVRTHFLKGLFTGSKSNTITTNDIQILMNKMPDLAEILFDYLYFREFPLEDDFEYTKFTVTRVKDFLGAIERQDGVLFYLGELPDILPETMGRWSASDIIRILENYKNFILGEDHRSYTYRNILQGENILGIYLETFILYEHTYKTLESILNIETAKRDELERLRNMTSLWRDNVSAMLDFSLYPEEVDAEDFIRQTWRELKFSELGTEKMLGILSAKNFLEPTPWAVLHKGELLSVVDKVPPALLGVMEIIFNFKRETDPNKAYLHMLKGLRGIRAILHRGSQHIFLEGDDLDAFKPFFVDGGLLVDLVQDLLPIVKRKILPLFLPISQDESSGLTFSELDKLLDTMENILVDVALTGPTFDFYRDKLEKNTLISREALFCRGAWYPNCPILKPNRAIDSFSFFTQNQMETFLEEFGHITHYYKYFRNDSSGIHVYDEFYHRHKKGYMEIVFLKRVIAFLMQSYNTQPVFTGSLSRNELYTFLCDFKPLLDYFGAWTESESPETFARNIVLLSDLFQHSSNGNNRIDIDEAVEFIGLTISGMKVRKQIVEQLTTICENSGTATNERIDLSCYRENFFQAFFNDFPYLKDHLPKLYRFIFDSSQEEKDNFLVSVEGFTRGQSNEPMSRHHFNLLVGALFNIESTFMRYDRNDDNILDENELNLAFPTYNNAICLVMEDRLPFACSEKWAKSALFSIVKHRRPPSWGQYGTVTSLFKYSTPEERDWAISSLFLSSILRRGPPPTGLRELFDFARFHYMGDRTDIVATRVSIGAILYYLAILPVSSNPENLSCF